MVDWIQPGKTIGIVGGGNIARLLTLSAKKLGYNVGVLDPDQGCPAKQIADWYVQAAFSDEDAFSDLSMKSDVVLYEMEAFHFNYVELMKRTVPVPQGEDVLSVSQDRVLQKAFLESISTNIAPYATIVSLEDIKETIKSIGYPCVLKSNRVDDRRKQHYILYGDEDIEGAQTVLRTGTCVLEAWIPKEKEMAIALIKDGEEKVTTYPITETTYRDNHLYQAITPARIPEEMEKEVERVARAIAEQLDFAGVIAVELFATSSGSLYVNEIVSHPHKAYHYTIDTAQLSQYEAHIRAACGMELPDMIEKNEKVVMVPFQKEHLSAIYRQMQIKPDWTFTLYQNESGDIFSEMGHVTIKTDNLERALTLLSDIDLWGQG